jgi:hypothetical protein
MIGTPSPRTKTVNMLYMQSLFQVSLLILLFIEPDISIIPEKWTHKNALKVIFVIVPKIY